MNKEQMTREYYYRRLTGNDEFESRIEVGSSFTSTFAFQLTGHHSVFDIYGSSVPCSSVQLFSRSNSLLLKNSFHKHGEDRYFYSFFII